MSWVQSRLEIMLPMSKLLQSLLSYREKTCQPNELVDFVHHPWWLMPEACIDLNMDILYCSAFPKTWGWRCAAAGGFAQGSRSIAHPAPSQVLPSRAQPPTPCDAQWLVCTALTTWAHFYHTAIPSTWTVSKLHLIASCAIITILRRLDLFGLFSLDYQIKVYLISLSFEWLVSIYFWDDKHLLLKWGNVWVFHLFLESHGAALPGRVNLTALRSSQLLELSWQMVRERLTEGLAKHWAAPSKIAGVYPAK